MKKVFLMFMVLLLIFPLINAAPPVTTVVQSSSGLTVSTNIPMAIPLNQTREWEIHILNGSQVFNSGVTCILHIYDEDGTGGHEYKNVSNTFDDYDIEFILPGSVHDDKGEYSYKAICNTTTQAGVYEKNYYVTKDGREPAEDVFKIFIYLVFILAVIGLIYTLFMVIAKLIIADVTLYDALYAWGFYIVMMFAVFLGEQYLLTNFVETVGGSFLDATIWTNGLLPFFAFVLSMIFKGLKKKKVPDPQEITGGKKW